jgi:hypothetical protein
MTTARALLLFLALTALLPAGCERPRATAPPAAALSPPDASRGETDIGLGLTVDDVRRANERVAAKARAEGARPGAALAACEQVAATGIIARCLDIGPGSGGEPEDRASFELPDPERGRGLVYHYGSDGELATGLAALRELAGSYGTFYVTNERARVVLVGAEALSTAERDRVKAIILGIKGP